MATATRAKGGKIMAQYAVKDIQANPFRRMASYPINQTKVDALVASINKTGFWDNVVARNGNGKPEIAYGHHRLEALRQAKGPNYKVDLIVKNLPDEDMLRIMADENMEEWTSNAAVTIETVHAVVQAFADGKIELDEVDVNKPGINKGSIRYAPSFILGAVPVTGTAAYTTQTVADFLGWLKPNGNASDKVHNALAALE